VLPDARRQHILVLLRQHGATDRRTISNTGADNGETNGISVDEPDRQPVAFA
jgi:hypothetical protein